MAVSEQERLKLFNCMAEAHGEEVARIIMESLPPVDWRNLATKEDILATKEDILATKDDISGVKNDVASLKNDVESLKNDVESLKNDVESLKNDVESLKEYVDTKFEAHSTLIQAQFVTMEANLSKRLSKQSWFLSLVFGGFAASVLTAVAAGAPFG